MEFQVRPFSGTISQRDVNLSFPVNRKHGRCAFCVDRDLRRAFCFLTRILRIALCLPQERRIRVALWLGKASLRP
ncbi:hypothetical protein TRP8649_03057 [Pelagimonas phthalicica]|uniref:Uncharacterized protein n=1 Tax=Pelagimonas phthalicica TaxID=1037362 RepID=A0A238JE65_9RHOB|nr:hypothetical protein CLV87_3058 [Pelagimonas phthalicica]SMX28929.1 hypothetical protein TRP8649_03057 [Pelagimonas phthalicica]